MASKILHLPEYCKLFKEFLVEELIFYESPLVYHYGKCSVIGKLCQRNQSYYLQNISFVGLDKEYCLKTGAVEILLLPTNYRSNSGDVSSLQNLVNGSFYEVHGETVFFSLTNDPKPSVKTTEELIKNLRLKHLLITGDNSSTDDKIIPRGSCAFSETEVAADLEAIKKRYTPAIQVHTIREIGQAEELIQCNLQLRLMRKKRRSLNY